MVTNTLQDIFIGIAGLIGAGKTTLADAIGAHWTYRFITNLWRTMSI